jgi:hypothetical protein
MSPPKQIHGLDVPISVLEGGPRSSFFSGYRVDAKGVSCPTNRCIGRRRLRRRRR